MGESLILVINEEGKDVKVIKFDRSDAIEAYIRNNPVLLKEDCIIIEGTVRSKGKHYVYDGRFQ